MTIGASLLAGSGTITFGRCQCSQLQTRYLTYEVHLQRATTSTNVPLPDASCSLTRWQHLSQAFCKNDVMAAILNCDVKLKILLRQSMCIYIKNTPAKFHPDRFETTESNKHKVNSDRRSVAELKQLQSHDFFEFTAVTNAKCET